MARSTWKAHAEHGKLDTEDKKELPDNSYSFPNNVKNLLTMHHMCKTLSPGLTSERSIR